MEKLKLRLNDLLEELKVLRDNEIYTTYALDQLEEKAMDVFELLEAKDTDWSCVAVDAPILVKNTVYSSWFKRHFKCLDSNANCPFVTFKNGKTSFSTKEEESWVFAKLPDQTKENN